MIADAAGSQVLRLPRLNNIAPAEGMFDNLSKLFYPHYPSHHNSIHYE